MMENPSKEELADIDSEEFLDDDIEDEQEFIEDEERISEIEALGGRKVDLASDSNATMWRMWNLQSRGMRVV